ncbi:MAG: hypothetical protein HZB23_12625 [Deltaproteobacteria bacterium]|nr:hypothetical protein [Deltaproteobacteria bacterium]
MKLLDDSDVKKLLHKGWMTHDAMWFYHSVLESGIETTNRINRAAVRSMAKIEAKRILKASGLDEVASMGAFKALMEIVDQVVRAEFMKFEIEFPSENMMLVTMPQCFAHDGMVKMGMAGQYQCGIFERFWGWLDALEIPYDFSPKVLGCMMHETGRCFREIRLDFDKKLKSAA